MPRGQFDSPGISPFEKPFALSIGPQRAGTSWLDRYLRTRGDVCLPSHVKEVFFFDRHYSRGSDFYTSHFKPQPAHRLVMEISTTAFDHPEAPRQVYNLLGPGITMLCPLRHPVIRSYSLYQHFRRYGIFTGSLREAAAEIPQILLSSHYAAHLRRWMEYFEPSKIHVVFQEDLETNQESFVRHICTVLGLDYRPPAPDIARRYNVTTASSNPFIAGTAQGAAQWLRHRKLYGVINLAKAMKLKPLIFGRECPEAGKNDIPPQDYAFLQERLHPEIERLEKLLGRSLPLWQI